jgi:ribulose-phosphate 3-epimerase
LTHLPLDVHLMIASPQNYVDAFIDSGADMVSFHIEAVNDPIPVLEQIRRKGVAAGIALNPKTPVCSVEDCLPFCDFALVMSVQAGFGGQSFDPSVLGKLEQIRQIAGERILLELDGGISDSTLEQGIEHGAELLVVGSAIFKHENYEPVIANLQSMALTSREMAKKSTN